MKPGQVIVWGELLVIEKPAAHRVVAVVKPRFLVIAEVDDGRMGYDAYTGFAVIRVEIVLGQIEVGLHVPAHIHHQFFLEEHSVHDVLVIADNRSEEHTSELQSQR